MLEQFWTRWTNRCGEPFSRLPNSLRRRTRRCQPKGGVRAFETLFKRQQRIMRALVRDLYPRREEQKMVSTNLPKAFYHLINFEQFKRGNPPSRV